MFCFRAGELGGLIRCEAKVLEWLIDQEESSLPDFVLFSVSRLNPKSRSSIPTRYSKNTPLNKQFESYDSKMCDCSLFKYVYSLLNCTFLPYLQCDIPQPDLPSLSLLAHVLGTLEPSADVLRLQ